MRRKTFRAATIRVRTATLCVRVAAVCLFVLFTHALAGAQTRPSASRPRQTATPAQSSTTANEDFELNITERRINETNFHAETAVEAGDDAARGLNLRIGVAVGASDIDVLLRNVRGHVRFRATLEPVLRLLDSRRDTRATPPPSAPPDSSP